MDALAFPPAPGAGALPSPAAGPSRMDELARQFESLMNAGPGAPQPAAANLHENALVQELMRQESQFKAVTRDLERFGERTANMGIADSVGHAIALHQRITAFQMESSTTLAVVNSVKSSLTTLIKNQ